MKILRLFFPDMINEREKQIEIEKKVAKLNIVMVGLPGSGKSSLVESFTIRPNYLALGEITRRELENDGPMAAAIRAKFETTEPWPADFVIGIVAPYFLDAKNKNTGFVVDGVPRKASEVKALASWMKTNKLPIDLLLYLKIDPELAFKRILARNNTGRLETREHYISRMKTYLDEEVQMIQILESLSNQSLVIDTERNSIESVKNLLLDFVDQQF